MAERLANEASSYLRTAKDQPVDWWPWGPEAFAAAKARDLPILLDIGAVWCHWCHVMDHESYEDPATAALINERFIAVKVDRDERPDVDARYQKAIQAMTGQGGWPLTGFLLPDGRCFYGGTYFPPVDAHGRPSFRKVLDAVSEAYAERREEILANASHLAEHLAQARAGIAVEMDAWDAILVNATSQMRAQFDVENGGFGRAPKFPHASAVDLLLRRGDPASRDMAHATLRAMRDGGVYDQLAGGFHRYSVDAEWIVPHFEKMLYDNAALLRNYVRGARVLGDPTLLRTADEIVGFLRDVLQQPDGGFGGSQDADIGADDDGDFFTWTLEELRAAIPDADLAKLMAMRYGVRERGEIVREGPAPKGREGPARDDAPQRVGMHHDPRRCVLRIAAEPEALSAALGHDVTADLARGKRLMQESRAKRSTPFVDPLRYTGWNAMAIQALLEHGEDGMALRALDLFLAKAFDKARGFSRGIGLPAAGFLDDNAQMLDALLEAHLATGSPRYLEAARETADVILAHFPHPEGGFADRAPALAPAAESAPLAAPERPVQDAPTASANGVALRALLRLAEATGEARYRDAALAALRALAGEAARLGLFGGALLLALDEARRPPPRVVARAADLAPYRKAARAFPGATFAAPEDPGVPEEARLFPGEGAMVCVGTRCLAPARSPDELRERLRSLSSS